METAYRLVIAGSAVIIISNIIRPDKSAGAERIHRSSTRRGSREGLCRGGGGIRQLLEQTKEATNKITGIITALRISMDWLRN